MTSSSEGKPDDLRSPGAPPLSSPIMVPPAADPVSSRRRFLAMGAGAVVAAAGARVADAQPPRGGSRKPALPAGTAQAIAVAAQWKDPVLRLVRRVTMGLDPEEITLARRLGYSGYLEYHLNAAAIDDSAVDQLVATRLPMTVMSGATLRAQDSNEAMAQLSDAAWYRALFSKRQLHERMVEFWTDHFAIDMDVQNVQWRKLLDDRDVIRPHALGNFRDLLIASAHSGAMLNFLDQSTSRTPTPNQNYAREIMELHTLGADGGYTQTDVSELARILTGWSTNNADNTFRFVRNFHDIGRKVFLGREFLAMPITATDVAMKSEGDTAIQMLLDHPSTAQFVAYKMARWLLAYEPPASVVDATAATYTRTRGDIKSMVRTILSSRNLMAAPAKYKRPFHLAISSMRALGTTPSTVPNVRPARNQSNSMGQPVFRWDQPDGYPDTMSWWSGLVITRWAYMTYLTLQNSGTTYRTDSLLFRVPDSADGVVQQINARLFGGEMPAQLRAGLLSYLRGGAYSDARVRETLSLALGAQEYQWY
jgi:uncharacterized protein (DUF1800 family)